MSKHSARTVARWAHAVVSGYIVMTGWACHRESPDGATAAHRDTAASSGAETTEASTATASTSEERGRVAPTPEAQSNAQEAASQVPVVGLARLACDRIELGRSVVFVYDWRLHSWSRPALRDAATLLTRFASDTHVRVEVDDLWNDETRGANVSQKRAEEVAGALIADGVPSDHVEARGFGAQRVNATSGAPRGVRIVVLNPSSGCAPSRPPSDIDLDGNPDGADACPAQPEDYDATDDSDGCPEASAGLVRLGCRSIAPDEPLRFVRGGLELRPSSSRRVAALAELLRYASFVRAVVVHERIRHDPRREDPPSSARAEAIRGLLVAAGVSEDRVLTRVDSVVDRAPRDYEITFSVYERSIDCATLDVAP